MRNKTRDIRKMLFPRQEVNSSYIKSLGYNEEKQTLQVEFHSGVIWWYTPVDLVTYCAMKTAASIGKYFHTNIKSNPDIKATEIKAKPGRPKKQLKST